MLSALAFSRIITTRELKLLMKNMFCGGRRVWSKETGLL
jgi:hypothetical protein